VSVTTVATELLLGAQTAGQKYVDNDATSNTAEDREEPDDSPVTSGPDTSATLFQTGASQSQAVSQPPSTA
jgi:hypothetical protein